MKSYLTGIIYLALLGLTFTFFAFMDGLEIVSTANTPKAIKIEVGDEQVTNIPITDYTYSPQSSINDGK